MNEICTNCGSIDTVKNKTEGSNKSYQFLLHLIFSGLILMFSPPAGLVVFVIGLVMLALTKPKRKFSSCASCSAENSFISVETPKGKQLMTQYHPDKEVQPEIQKNLKKQTWHGLW